MKAFLVSILFCFSFAAYAQKSDKLPRYFGEPVVADSTASIMIPVRYNSDLLSSNKLALWHDFYSNVIFYDFTTDTYKKLFADDTFIKGFTRANYGINRYDRENPKPENQSKSWVFYFVKTTDYNRNGRIDNDDPSVLFVSDKAGNNLKAITAESENAVSIEIFEKQGFALVKMQRDIDNNRKFDLKDKDFYYVRLDLKDLSFGNKIEVNL